MSFDPSAGALPAVDLFSGAGGLSLGLGDAGFEVVAACEWDKDSCETFTRYHANAELYQGDIASVSFRHLRGSVALLAGGPPCQPWSTGGLRLGAEDPRDGFPQFVRVLSEIQPEAFLMENVAGLVRSSRRSHFDHLIGRLEAEGFVVQWSVLNAADFGVPQKRQRLFVVGTRHGKFEFPFPSHGQGLPHPHRAAGSVIDALRPRGESNPTKVTFAKNPDLRPDPYDGHLYNGGGRPIDLRRPSPTLLASMGGNKTPWIDTLGVVEAYHRHLAQGGDPRTGVVPGARRITPEEAARIQTFPDGMRFAGRRSSQYRQIGNAVPPMLATQVGLRLRVALGRSSWAPGSPSSWPPASSLSTSGLSPGPGG